MVRKVRAVLRTLIHGNPFDAPNAKHIAERVDLTIVNLSILKTNKAKAIRFSTLDALCRALKCQPGELLEYVDKK